nr:hypothetical protein [Tanacetum cinerariifolium]
MYPRFLQLMIRKQVGDLSTHTTKYTSPALTQKVFANMRRVGKGFSEVEIPLFEGMLIAQQVAKERDAEVHGEEVNVGDTAEGDVSAVNDEVPTVVEEPSIPSPTPPPQPYQDIPSTSQEQPTQPQSPQRIDTSDETVMDDVSNQRRRTMNADTDVVLKDDKKVADAIKDVQESVEDHGRIAESQAKIYKIDLDHENKYLSIETITAASTTITAVAAQVPAATLIAAPARVTGAPRRRTKGVVIRDPEESSPSIIIPAETKSKDKGKEILDEAIDHVKKKAKEDPIVKKYQVLKRKPQTESQARKNMIVYLKNVAGFKMDYFKGMSYDDIRPIFEAKFNSNVAFLQKTREEIEEEESRALKRINETPAERSSKRQNLDEEVEELKRHLQIVSNEDDDFYTEATPLARKVPVVDYKIIKLNNKPYYKIIRADDTHKLYISFMSLLRNFDREDLEALWSLVKERFSTTNPKNFSNDFLMVTLGAMFEKPDIHA